MSAATALWNCESDFDEKSDCDGDLSAWGEGFSVTEANSADAHVLASLGQRDEGSASPDLSVSLTFSRGGSVSSGDLYERKSRSYSSDRKDGSYSSDRKDGRLPLCPVDVPPTFPVQQRKLAEAERNVLPYRKVDISGFDRSTFVLPGRDVLGNELPMLQRGGGFMQPPKTASSTSLPRSLAANNSHAQSTPDMLMSNGYRVFDERGEQLVQRRSFSDLNSTSSPLQQQQQLLQQQQEQHQQQHQPPPVFNRPRASSNSSRDKSSDKDKEELQLVSTVGA